MSPSPLATTGIQFKFFFVISETPPFFTVNCKNSPSAACFGCRPCAQRRRYLQETHYFFKIDSALIRDILFKLIHIFSGFKVCVPGRNLYYSFLNIVICVVLLGFIFAFLFLFCLCILFLCCICVPSLALQLTLGLLSQHVNTLLSNYYFFLNFVASHTVVFGIIIYYGPSNTTLYYQRCLIQQLTGRHVSVSR